MSLSLNCLPHLRLAKSYSGLTTTPITFGKRPLLPEAQEVSFPRRSYPFARQRLSDLSVQQQLLEMRNPGAVRNAPSQARPRVCGSTGTRWGLVMCIPVSTKVMLTLPAQGHFREPLPQGTADPHGPRPPVWMCYRL